MWREHRHIKYAILDIVEKQGKFQDPVTKSGGILIGYVKSIGDDVRDQTDLKPGEKIATLVSLSLTPLKLDEIVDIDLNTDQVKVKGTAILFASGGYAKLPDDLPETLAMAVLDVAGAPVQVRLNAIPGDTVLVLGAGKAGLLCLQEAMNRVYPTGKVVCIEFSKTQCTVVEELGLAHHVIQAQRISNQNSAVARS